MLHAGRKSNRSLNVTAEDDCNEWMALPIQAHIYANTTWALHLL